MPNPTTEEMLIVCLEWLGNARKQDYEAYMRAMPNNVLGQPAMVERFSEIKEEERVAATASEG